MFRRRKQEDPKAPASPNRNDISSINAFVAPGEGGANYTVVVRKGSPLAVAHASYEQYRESGDLASLQAAVAASTEALSTTSDDPLVLAEVHQLRCTVLGQDYRRGGQRALVGQALASGRQPLSLRGSSDPYYTGALTRLADVLNFAWEKDKDRDALAAAERLLRDAARTWPDSHP